MTTTLRSFTLLPSCAERLVAPSVTDAAYLGTSHAALRVLRCSGVLRAAYDAMSLALQQNTQNDRKAKESTQIAGAAKKEIEKWFDFALFCEEEKIKNNLLNCVLLFFSGTLFWQHFFNLMIQMLVVLGLQL